MVHPAPLDEHHDTFKSAGVTPGQDEPEEIPPRLKPPAPPACNEPTVTAAFSTKPGRKKYIITSCLKLRGSLCLNCRSSPTRRHVWLFIKSQADSSAGGTFPSRRAAQKPTSPRQAVVQREWKGVIILVITTHMWSILMVIFPYHSQHFHKGIERCSCLFNNWPVLY